MSALASAERHQEGIMHPEIARTLVAQRRDELTRNLASNPRTNRRRLPRWHVSWTRTVLAPAGSPGAAGGNRAGQAGRRGSSLVIIISAYRSA
jgi:hypothetical protein